MLCATVAQRLAVAVREGRLGRAEGVTALAVTMHESHIAWASFEMAL